MSFDPLRAVGKLLRVSSDAPRGVFLGSCFAFRDLVSVVTAAHCVEDISPDELAVQFPALIIVDAPGVPVTEVVTHPEADLAVLCLGFDNWSVDPFRNVMDMGGLGADLYAYGYPENVMDMDDREPTSRLFKGYAQRVLFHRSPMGFRYQGVELNFACPAGLSGGPVFQPTAPWGVLGVATENFESATVLEAVEEVAEDAAVTKTQYRRVLSYGVAARLDAHRDWLDSTVPPLDLDSFRERQAAAREASAAPEGPDG